MRNFIRISRDTRKIAATGFALAAAGVCLTAGLRPAAATPSGLITVPSTDIYDRGTIHLDVDYLGFPSFNTPVGRQRSVNAFSTGLTYGVGPDTDRPFGRTEVGFDYLVSQTGLRGRSTSQRLSFNIKTQLYNNDEQGVRVVVGASSLGSKATAAGLGYLNGSKNFGKAGRVHLGVARVFNDNPAFTGPSGDRTLIQIGYERLITDQLHFIGEYGTGKSAFGSAGVSLIYYIDDKSDVQLGVLRPNQRGGADVFYYLGYDRNFGKRAAAPPEPNPQGEARN